MTLKQAKAILKPVGVSVNKMDSGDYRVCLHGADPITAYYTDDLEDAVLTGLHMASSHRLR